jgi:hypothetical protein
LEAIHAHGRLTRQHVRRLFFRKRHRQLTSVQAVNARLLKLAQQQLISPVVVTSTRGAGPYAYALTKRGRALLRGPAHIRSAEHGPVWHRIELAEIRVRLEESLAHHGGSLVEWLGDDTLRGLLRTSRGPIPDALVHWRLRHGEGVFLLELDRGTESLAVLTAKLERYRAMFAKRTHRELLPGLGLRPRLAIVVSSAERATRLVRWFGVRYAGAATFTFAVAVFRDVIHAPLSHMWWRSDLDGAGSIVE